MLTMVLNLLKVSDDKQGNKKKEVTYYKCKETCKYPSRNRKSYAIHCSGLIAFLTKMI